MGSSREHQKNFVLRAITQNALLADHEVGAGKTYESIVAIMQQKKMGLINKPLFLVPNNIILQWRDDFLKLYPNANILVASDENMSKKHRINFLTNIMHNDYDAILMKHSQFNNIVPDEETLKSIYKNFEKNINDAYEKYENNLNKKEEERLKRDKSKVIRNLNNKLDQLVDKGLKDGEIMFSSLGIDALIVDEAHMYKNLFFISSMSNVRGLGNEDGSSKALRLFTATTYLHNLNKKVYFLTGTPISNTIAEFYTMQRYLQPKILQEAGIHSFDDWARNFGEVQYTYMLDSSGTNFQLTPSFSKFINVGDLMNMYKQNADIITNKDIEKFSTDVKIPKMQGGKPIMCIAPRSEDQAKFIGIEDENGNYNEGSIIWRLAHKQDDIQNNNDLKCISDSRKVALDMRMIDENAPDFENSKLNLSAKNIYEEYEKTKDLKGTQFVFCSLGIPKVNSQSININDEKNMDFFTEYEDENVKNDETEKDDIKMKSVNVDEALNKTIKFDVYSEITKKLIALGIPQNEIAFMHDCKGKDKKKKELIDKFNKGEIRILFGSTSLMGAGVNANKRATAMHMIDLDWRPSDITQRYGRIIRQGNELFESGKIDSVKVFIYLTEKTYDAKMCEHVEIKAKSIEQIKNADIHIREAQDIDISTSQVANELKSATTGNPYMEKRCEIEEKLKLEELKYKRFLKQIRGSEDALKKNESEMKILHDNNVILQSFQDVKLPQNEIKVKFDDKEYIILKNPKKEEEKQNDINKENVRRLFDSKIAKIFKENEVHLFSIGDIEVNVFKYLSQAHLSLQKKDNVDLVYNPENGFIKIEGGIITTSFQGSYTRINNFLNNVPKIMQQNKNKISTLEKQNIILNEKIKQDSYSNMNYLLALREDFTKITQEINFLKEPSYISYFTPMNEKITNKIDEEFLQKADKFNNERQKKLMNVSHENDDNSFEDETISQKTSIRQNK